MPTKRPLLFDAEALRRRAEEQVKTDFSQGSEPFSPEMTTRLLHELRVHQVELEIQNEELRRVEGELNASLLRYFDLYNLAPIGYLTLSEQGVILEANLTAANLLGVTRGALVKQPLSHFILPDDQDIYSLHRKQLVETGVQQSWDMRMLRADGSSFWANLQAHPAEKGECRITLSDISARRQEEEELALHVRIGKIFLTIPDDEMFNEVLAVLLDVMHSPFGVFGYLDEAGALVVPTMTRQIWDRCQVAAKTIRFPRETWGDSSWPSAIREKKVIHSNKPSNNTPQGHISVLRHISLPILLQGEVIGLFQVANKATDYTTADLLTLESIAGYVAPILDARLHRNRLEEQMMRLSRHHELILSSVEEGILGLDLQGKHTFVNPAAAKMLGYREEELLGQPSHSCWHHSKRTAAPILKKSVQLRRPFGTGLNIAGPARFSGGKMAAASRSSMQVRPSMITVDYLERW